MEVGEPRRDLRHRVLRPFERPHPALHGLQPLGEAIERPLRIDLGEPRLQRRQPRHQRLHRRILLREDPGQPLGDLRHRVLRPFERPHPALHGLQPLGEAIERALRVDLGEPCLQGRQPRHQRLHRRILLREDPGQSLADLRHRVIRPFERPHPALHGLQPLGEAIERALRVDLGEPCLQRRQPRHQRLDRGVLLAVEVGQPLGNLGRRPAGAFERRHPARDPFQPLGEAVQRPLRIGRRQRRLEGGKPALDRSEPGEHGLSGGVARRLQRRELPGERGQRPRVGGPLLRPHQPFGERREPGVERSCQGFEPGFEPGLHQRLGIARGEVAFEGAEPGEHRLQPRVPAVVEAGDLLGERPHRGGRSLGLGLQRREFGAEVGPRRHALALKRLDAGLEPLQRLASLGPAAVEKGKPGLERGDAGERRLGVGVARLLQPRQPLAEIGDGAGEVGRGRAAAVERREPGLGAGRGRRLGGLERAEPLAEAVEERPRLGRRADLLDRAHPGAELVEAGERGLERGVLVADQPEELARHRLQPLLRRARLRRQRVDPPPDLGLGRGHRLEPLAGGARRPAGPRRHRRGATDAASRQRRSRKARPKAPRVARPAAPRPAMPIPKGSIATSCLCLKNPAIKRAARLAAG